MAARRTFEILQESFEPYVRSREEASHIRRILALHLDSCFESGEAPKPLFLVDSTHSVQAGRDTRGLQREYIRAVAANVAALQEHEEVRKAATQQPPPGSAPAPPKAADHADILEEHLYLIRLEQRRQRLEAIQKRLALLGDKPPAALDYLDASRILAGVPAPPEVPRDVVDGIAAASSSPDGAAPGKAELMGLVDELERSVLRTRVALGKEEALLAELKRSSPAARTKPTDGARFHALSATRNELIGWIEAELGKAGNADGGGDEDDDGAEGGSVREDGDVTAAVRRDAEETTSSAAVAGRLSAVAAQYDAYTTRRKALLQTATHTPQLPALKHGTPSAHDGGSAAMDDVHPAPAQPATTTTTNAHLVTPHLDALLRLAHEQKGILQHKAAANVALARQLRDTCLGLDRLAAESQLLLAGNGGGGGSRESGGGGTGPRSSNESLLLPAAATAEHLDVATYVKPWLDAAATAKMATLEAVAEKVEEGQLALEATVATLAQVDALLGKGVEESRKEMTEEENDDGETDVWLAAEKGSSGERLARRNAERRREKAAAAAKPFDIWDTLDGNLCQGSRPVR